MEQLAHIPVSYPMPEARRRVQSRRWPIAAIAAGVAAAFLAGAGGWRAWNDPSRRSARLLAEAMESRRTFDWRLDDGKWLARDLRRGDSDPQPAPLLEAEAVLTRGAAAHENDARWLGLRGRAAILEYRFGPAIDLLRKAVEVAQPSAEVWTDLSVAYGLNAERSNEPSDFAASVEYATRALHAQPDYSRALFNRALAFERLHMVDRAIEDWESFLKYEKDEAWKKEGRRRLDDLRKSHARLLERRRLDEPSDAILDTRAVEWLASDRARASAAGKTLEARYHDRWLAEAAAEPVDSSLLLQAARATLSGQFDDALRLSREAAGLFPLAPAHAARAQLEEVNALNRSMQAAACVERADRLARAAQARSYLWIRLQALLQGSVCRAMEGRLGEADAGRVQVRHEAAADGMEGVELRAIGIWAGARTIAGDLWAAWQDNRDALERLSESPYPPQRIQQCILTYSQSAELWGWRAASFEFMKSAADTLRDTPNRMTEGADRARAASLAEEAGLPGDAAGEARIAERLFLGLPESLTRTRYLNSVRILQAESDLAAGRTVTAVASLTTLSRAAVLQREQWHAHQLLGLGLMSLGRRARAVEELQASVGEMQRRVQSLPRRADQRQALDEGAAAYRALATALLAEGPSLNAQALHVWLQGKSASEAPTLVFLAVDDGYAVWSRHGKGFLHIAANRARIRASIDRLLRLAATPQSPVSEIQEQGRFLYDQLLRPVDGLLERDGLLEQGDVLSISPDEELTALPFDLLVTPDGHWLADRSPIAITSSGTSSSGSVRRASRALVVGVPAAAQALPPLPESYAETEMVAAHFAAPRTLSGQAATGGAVAAELPQAEVVHYSGHGFSAGGLTGVYLADGALTPISLHGLSLSECRLTVLSACLTAIGGARAAGSLSLAQAFLDAGAGAVIASRWEVDSRAGFQLMNELYAALDAGACAAQALKSASARLRQRTEFAHPFYWDAYQIYL
jgi:CHAT domain-containing protein/Flp pilus assembly protein TadD